MIEITDFKVHCLVRGVGITEHLQFNKLFKQNVVNTVFRRIDVDGVSWNIGTESLIEEYDTSIYLQRLQEAFDVIENLYVRRHQKNINRCAHSTTLIVDNKKCCIECMADLGSTFIIDLKNN